MAWKEALRQRLATSHTGVNSEFAWGQSIASPALNSSGGEGWAEAPHFPLLSSLPTREMRYGLGIQINSICTSLV